MDKARISEAVEEQGSPLLLLGMQGDTAYLKDSRKFLTKDNLCVCVCTWVCMHLCISDHMHV